jgi:hypothetical protein
MISFLLYLFPFLGLSGLGALAPLAMGLGKALGALSDGLGPLLKGLAEGLVAFSKAFLEGFMDMVDNIKSVMFVLVVIGCTFLYVKHQEENQCNVEIVEIKKKMMPKQPVRTVNDFKWPWEGLF